MRQRLDERARLGLGGGGQVRHAVEMHEEHPAAALHHAPRRHRRVDAAREQRRHCTGGADGQPAGAFDTVERDIGLRRQHLDVDHLVGVLEIHARGHARHDEGAQRAVEIHAAHGIGLERAPRGDAERREGPPLEQPVEQRLHRVERGRRAVRERDAGHAEDARRAVAGRLRRGMVLEVHQDAAGELLDRGGARVGQRALDVAPQVPQEQRAIAALEADLVVVHDEHGSQPHHVSPPPPPARGPAPARRAC